jgi:hypothetical protein
MTLSDQGTIRDGNDVFRHKQAYEAIFTASGPYHVARLLETDHASGHFQADVPDGERGVVCLLRKSLSGGYLPQQHG